MNRNRRSDVKSWSWQQSQMFPCSGGIDLSDRGFRYGQHLFETIAVRSGNALFVEEHCARLEASAKRHGFPFSQRWHYGMRHFFNETLFDDGIIRIYLTAGVGAPGSPIVAPGLFVFWEEASFPNQEIIEQGMKIVSLARPVGTTCWGEKTGNYWEHLYALESARQAGAEEALIFDAHGYVISVAMANIIFWLDDGKVITPSLKRGARNGVVRSLVYEQLLNLQEDDIRKNDLQKVVAAAITNSRLGVMPVATLDGMRLPQFVLSLALALDYRRLEHFK